MDSDKKFVMMANKGNSAEIAASQIALKGKKTGREVLCPADDCGSLGAEKRHGTYGTADEYEDAAAAEIYTEKLRRNGLPACQVAPLIKNI